MADELRRAWIVVLQRHEYMLTLGRHVGLHAALNNSRAAHVHNAISDTLLIDQFREISALILDDDKRSPSLRKVLGRLRTPGVLELLRDSYQQVTGGAVHLHGTRDPDLIRTTKELLERQERERNDREFLNLRDRIEEVRVGVFDHPVAAQIEIARNKAVAHYEISHDGNDWKTWRIGETRLTYGALSEFVDRCSDAIEFSTLFILRGNITFAEFRNVAARYAAEYVEALALGMRELTKPEAE